MAPPMVLPGSSEIAHVPRRFPIQAVDRFFLITEDRLPSQTCMWALEFEGLDLDGARFQRAVTAAVARYPKAAARRAAGRGLLRRPEWELIQGAADRVVVMHPSEFGAGATLTRALADLMNAPLCPSEGPLIQFHWLPRKGERPVLCFRFHHALADGYGSLVLLRDVFRAYDGTELEPRSTFEKRPPLVGGSAWSKFRMLLRLFWFHFGRSVASGFRAPDKLFARAARAESRFGLASRMFAIDQAENLRRAASTVGASVNDLFLAAWALGIERFSREQGRNSSLLRFTVNQRLRKPGDGLETLSSAFQIWIGREQRRDPRALVRTIKAQVRDCLRRRVAQATALFSGLLKLPFPLVRRLLLPTLTRPRLSDTLIVSNLEGAMSMLAAPDGSCLGGARIVVAHALVVPPAGVGALATVSNGSAGMNVALNYLLGLLDEPGANRLLGLVDAALCELYVCLTAAEGSSSEAVVVGTSSSSG
jgi:NRPS condensation-like uncharacterized protein